MECHNFKALAKWNTLRRLWRSPGAAPWELWNQVYPPHTRTWKHFTHPKKKKILLKNSAVCLKCLSCSSTRDPSYGAMLRCNTVGAGTYVGALWPLKLTTGMKKKWTFFFAFLTKLFLTFLHFCEWTAPLLYTLRYFFSTSPLVAQVDFICLLSCTCDFLDSYSLFSALSLHYVSAFPLKWRYRVTRPHRSYVQ